MKLLNLEKTENTLIGKFSTVKGGFIIVELKEKNGKKLFSYDAKNSNIKSFNSINNNVNKALKILKEIRDNK